MQNVISIGIMVMLIGFALVIIGSLLQAGSGKTDTKVAFGGFIGFIPFGFANDKRMLYLLMGIMAFFLILWVILRMVR